MSNLQCSRCLKDFWSELSIPVDVVYHPVEELKGEDKHEIKAEELDMDFYSGEEMDLLDPGLRADSTQSSHETTYVKIHAKVYV